MKGGYVLVNGVFHSENEAIFNSQDILRLNKGINASFRAENNIVLFGEENFSYLQDSLSTLGIPSPREWNLPRFRKDVSRLLNKNHLYLAARINIHFFEGNGDTDYFLTAEEIPRGFYPLNEPGFLIDFYEEGKKPETRFNAFEYSSRYIWISAGEASATKSKHSMLISKINGSVCEGIYSSFGFITGDLVSFPSKENGGFYPPLTGVIKKCAKTCGFQVTTRDHISHDDLLNADEMFLINNTLGIQKVLGLAGRRYYSNKTTMLAAKLKSLAMEYAANSE